MSLADCQIEEAQESRKTRAEERRSNQKLVEERKPEGKRDANTTEEVKLEAQQDEMYPNQETEKIRNEKDDKRRTKCT